MAISPDDAIQQAADALRGDDLAWAETLCLAVLKKEPEDPRALNLLGAIAVKVGRPQHARQLWQRAIATAPPGWDVPSKNLSALDRAIAENQPLAASPPPDARLLIKSWGKGFWSDVDHVLGGLLAAEMTGRTPIVHWGPNCLFTNPGIDNAWPIFFQPINDLSIDDVAGSGLTYFPPKWSATNLREENVNVWRGPGSRVTNLALLNRPEHVVVADFHVSVAALLPWIEEGSPLHGKPIHDVYRYLIDRHLHPQPQVMESVESFHASHLAGQRVLAVHVRGTDKSMEQHALAEVNEQYFPAVDRLTGEGQWRIFLLTDDARVADAFARRYGDRVVMAEAERSSSEASVHGRPDRPGVDRTRRGFEILRDSYLAARADHFLGNGGSNVSAMIVHLRDWPDDAVTLLAPLRLYRPWPVLYRPA